MFVYDTGALLAAERGTTQIRDLQTTALDQRVSPLVPAPVLAQAWRGGPQAALSRLLKGCEIVAMDEDLARRVGMILGKAGRRDVVDAMVVAVAADNPGFTVLTSDPDDLRALAAASGNRLLVLTV